MSWLHFSLLSRKLDEAVLVTNPPGAKFTPLQNLQICQVYIVNTIQTIMQF